MYDECSSCYPHCKHCTGSTEQDCTECQDGYFLSPSNIC